MKISIPHQLIILPIVLCSSDIEDYISRLKVHATHLPFTKTFSKNTFQDLQYQKLLLLLQNLP